MKYMEMLDAVQDAVGTIENGDKAIKMMAKMMVGRLRLAGVGPMVLGAFKQELKDFNRNTGRWKED